MHISIKNKQLLAGWLLAFWADAEACLTFKEEEHSIRCQLPQGVSSAQVQLVCSWLAAICLPAYLHGVRLVHDVNKHAVGEVTLKVGQAGHLEGRKA